MSQFLHESMNSGIASLERGSQMNSKSEARRIISESLAEVVPARQGNGLRAIVLTGSLARDEATVVARDSGFELLGDADVLLVYDTGASEPDCLQMEIVLRKAEERCLQRGLRATVNANPVSLRYFQKLPKSIFAYELRRCAKVIWGETQILKLIREFSAAEIPREDAWRMISNRMIELMDASRHFIGDSTTADPGLYYAIVKLFLDMATSYLVFAGEYAPSYRERAERLLATSNCHLDSRPFPLGKFTSRVQQCTAWKLSGDLDHSYEVLELWREATRYLRRLWRWEIMQMTAATGEQTIAALIERLGAKQTSAARLRGWLSVTKRWGWLKSSRHWPQWTQQCLQASPRYVVYGAAAEVFFHLPYLVNRRGRLPRSRPDWDKIRACLPVTAPHRDTHNVAPWQTLADDVVWNYEEFLVGTHS
jgi:hypothetical protein